MGATMTDYRTLPEADETALLQAVTIKGPIAVAISAIPESFQLYENGQFKDSSDAFYLYKNRQFGLDCTDKMLQYCAAVGGTNRATKKVMPFAQSPRVLPVTACAVI